jgi:hypothetical protein
MRAATITSATIVVIGLYLALAAGIGLDPTWIGIGMLTIAVVGALTMTAGAAPTAPANRVARS